MLRTSTKTRAGALTRSKKRSTISTGPGLEVNREVKRRRYRVAWKMAAIAAAIAAGWWLFKRSAPGGSPAAGELPELPRARDFKEWIPA